MDIQQLSKLLQYIPEFEHVYLAWSFSRWTATSESDIDLVYEPKKQLSLFELWGIAYALEQKTGRRIDLVNKAHIRPALKQSILDSLVQIY